MEEEKKKTTEIEKGTKDTGSLIFWIIILIIVALLNSYVVNGFVSALFGIARLLPLFLFAIWILNIANRKYTKNMKIVRILIVILILCMLSALEIKNQIPTTYNNEENAITNSQKDEMKEYAFKHFSLLSPEQFTEIQLEQSQIGNYEYIKRYITDTDKDISILFEEGTLNEKASVQATLYNAIAALLGEEEATKNIEKAITKKSETINQSSCDYQNGLWGYKTLAFTKDNKYVVITIAFDRTQKELETIANKIAESIKILM